MPPAPLTHSITRDHSEEQSQAMKHPPHNGGKTKGDGVALSMLVQDFLEKRDQDRYASTPALVRDDASLEPIMFTRNYTGADGVKVKAIFEFDPSHPGLDQFAARAMVDSKTGKPKHDSNGTIYGGCLTVRIRKRKLVKAED